jgi:glycosyltransferase involved in cell wall biosynthesis
MNILKPRIEKPFKRVGLDFSSLDRVDVKGGQYRYIIDLVRGLANLEQNKFQFVLFGSHSQPVDELKDIFHSHHQWFYQQIKPWPFKGSDYLNHLRYSAIIYANRIDIWHVLHEFLPIACPCPIVKTEYDLMYELFDEYREAIVSRPYKIKKWITQNRAARIITISQTTADDLQTRWKIPPSKIFVVHLGSDLSQIITNRKVTSLIPEENELVILSPFNLEPRKNLCSLILAMPTLLEKYPNLRLVLFGRAACTPEREKEYQQLVQKLRIEDKIHLTGFLEDKDLAALYQNSSIFVFPSLYEGFGLPVLEAMSMGACVVVREASAMAEIVGDAGVTVEPCDSDNLASAILDLFNDESKRNNLKELACQRAKLFSIENMALKTLQVYKKLIDH